MSPLIGSTRRAPAPPVVLDDAAHRVTCQAVGLLLGYPDAALREALPVLCRAVEGLPSPLRTPLLRLADHLAAGSLPDLAADYVATFDLQRRCCPYLTYAVYGDTRKRGMALLRIKSAYRAAGLELAGDELPDHLAVVCEFAATGHRGAAERVLTEFRVGLELLRIALLDARSPYADAVEAVSLTLPALPARDRETVLALAREGPPAEDVGLEAYPASAPPDYLGGRR